MRISHIEGPNHEYSLVKLCTAITQVTASTLSPLLSSAVPMWPPRDACGSSRPARTPRSSVRAQPRRTDSTHAILTITNVLITLQLQTNVWVPIDAPQTIVDHEEGHREIAEYYYQSADKLAERIAASYIGKRVDVTGPELDVALNQKLLEIATEIYDAYTKQINSSPTQLLYDDITDHSRNGTLPKDAVDHAIKNAPIEAAPTAK